jgi:uncharacterized protein YgiB involved in biofilm formation
MTSQNPEPNPPQIRPIRRRQVQQYLAVSAFIATQVITGCSDSSESSAVPEATVPALFYETTEQCEAHAKKQQDQYAVQLKAYEAKQPPTPPPVATSTPAATPTPTPTGVKPTPPVMKAADCAAQMAAAQQEHDRHAPVYQSLSECQADDVQCEATPVGYATSGYRPMFGGTYFYPYGNSYSGTAGFASGVHSSSSSHFYAPRTVYRGFDAGSVVTPQGTVLSKSNVGVAVVPQHTSLAAPARPAGVAARGTITGRDTKGFGSTFKSTGRGGK